MVNLNEIFVMWSKKTILQKEELELGWGATLSISKISDILTKKYQRSYISTIDEVDPIIIIDGALYDGWGRCSIAHALGDQYVKAAMFKRKEKMQYHVYITDPSNFDLAKSTLNNNQVSYIEELFNHGLIFHFASKTDKQKAIQFLEKVINSKNEGLWRC
jgi:hypothetical protein